MVETLLDRDETPCIEDAAIGSGSITIFLKALTVYCGDFIEVKSEATTFEGRNLYEVSITENDAEEGGEKTPKPVIIIEAGQSGGMGSVDLAMFLIEQLVACEEYAELIQKVQWVILPCTNPDGFEYSNNFQFIDSWNKNRVPTNGSIIDGVDISRNFNESWNICPGSDSVYSRHYPGQSSATEAETLFMINVFNKYSTDLKAYLSLRRDGHSILYPYASINGTTDTELTKKTAGDIAAKVNYRAGTVQWFVNDSIYNMNGKPHCGHSVDYVFINLHVPYSYEMRVFLESDTKVLQKYQKLPVGYKASLRNGYFSGIRELYNAVVHGNKRNNIF